jgi:hypothetical protein
MNKERSIKMSMNLNLQDVSIKVFDLLNKPSPYILKDGKRIRASTGNPVYSTKVLGPNKKDSN